MISITFLWKFLFAIMVTLAFCGLLWLLERNGD